MLGTSLGVISRYFKRLTGRIRPRRAGLAAVSADADGLRIGDERVAWRDVLRIDAYKRDIYTGDFLCVAVLAVGGRMFEINEESPGWTAAGDAVERFLPGSLPHAQWMLRLIAANAGGSVPIYPVTQSGLVQGQ